MKISALLFVIFCAVAFATPAFAETQKMTAKVLKGFAKSIYGEEEAPRMMASGKFPCLACTVAVGLVEGMAIVNSEAVDKVLAKVCNLLPSVRDVSLTCPIGATFPHHSSNSSSILLDCYKILPNHILRILDRRYMAIKAAQPWCVGLVQLFGPTIIKMIENKETPDKVCQQLGACTNPQCHLFPLPKRSQTTSATYQKFEPIHIESDIPVVNHRPLIDLDGDGFSTIFPLRGYAWRGKDCDDWDSGKHPGRKPVISGDNGNTDYNCNGIQGINPSTGVSYEQELCAGTNPMGIAILGDSAAAHFAIPPAWLTPALIKSGTYHDFLNILEDEIDWPDMSGATGFQVSNWTGKPGNSVSSIYMKNIARNLCSSGDRQNIAVNGARSGAMANGISQTFSRNPQTDTPVLLNLALIGNDVCSGHAGFDSMTTPAQMMTNTMTTLKFLDENRLPAGSKVLLTGLADGRVLYEALATRIHPIGSARNDVTYAQFYDYLNCMDSNPCWGWMNTNATVRNITAEHQRALNDVLANIAKTQSFKNFDILYLGDPFTAIIPQWLKNGGQLWQLIEAADGFHPSQIANQLIADYIWNLLETKYPSFLPPVNPNNMKIQQLFAGKLPL